MLALNMTEQVFFDDDPNFIRETKNMEVDLINNSFDLIF